MKGTRISRLGIPAAFCATAALVLIPLFVAGCGGSTTTTSTSAIQPGSTTTASVATSESTATTATTAPPTTGTTGIVIDIPTTTTLLETTTTTESLSNAEKVLPNGHIKAMGYIDKVYVSGGKRYIRIDYAVMLTGTKATNAAIADGVIPPGGSLDTDYYIQNTSHQKRTFEVSNAVAVTTSTRWVPGDDMGAACTWADFKSFWGPQGALDDSEKHLHAVPWWIERNGQTVVKIDEQYLP